MRAIVREREKAVNCTYYHKLGGSGHGEISAAPLFVIIKERKIKIISSFIFCALIRTKMYINLGYNIQRIYIYIHQ